MAEGEGVDVDPAAEAAELKQQGNSAYGRGEVEEAVRLWNLAIRRHVQELEAGKAFGEESTTLERSIYLNLAQGYLKLGDAEKALRACKVVLFADPTSAKARFRAAEATLRLQRYEEARTLLQPLLDPPVPEAARLLQKVQAEEKAQALRAKREDAEAQKLLAQRMSAGLSGFAEQKPDPVVEVEAPSRMPPMADLDTVSHMTDISAEAAQAARARQARLKADEGPAPPDATFTDFDAFRAKAMKRSQKYAMAAERSRKHGEAAQRSVRLNWLRAGRAGGELEGFAAPLREELRELEAFDEAQRAMGEAEEPDTGEWREGSSSDAAQTMQMEEMD
eukprot:s2485_g4.t1